MKAVRRTESFDRWLKRLRDKTAVQKILVRITRLELGNPGDHKNLGRGLIEMRIDYGPGYRVYCTERNNTTTLLLCGGDKDSQDDDIAKARAMIEELT
jgi:putative addiction module killer protein